MDRRVEPRIPVELMINKYVDGYPYLCEAVNVSWTGVMVRRVLEPMTTMRSFSLEVGLPDVAEPIWIWARSIWTMGRYEALRFAAVDPKDARVLARFVARLAS